MAVFYWLSKFSQEALIVELFLLFVVLTIYCGYWLFLRKKYGSARSQIPDHIVRAYLTELISHAEGFKSQLFGDHTKLQIDPSKHPVFEQSVHHEPVLNASGPSSGDLDALRGELHHSVAKGKDLEKQIDLLKKEKADLDHKLAEAAKGGAAPVAAAPSADNKEMQEKMLKLESKLAEYEVIEDDLANLKKYMQENKQLRAELEALKGGAPAPQTDAVEASAPAPTPKSDPIAAVPAPAPEAVADLAPKVETASVAASPEPVTTAAASLASAEAAATTEQAAQGLAQKVEENIAPPAPAAAAASAVDPKVVAAAQTAAPVTEAVPTAAAPGTPAQKQDKSDADLLNEFERMLSS